MLRITDDEVMEALEIENPWWSTGKASQTIREFSRRSYFGPFSELASQTDVRRSVILLGPRRVGKTVLILQFIDALLSGDEDPESILYISLDRPLYNDMTLEQVVNLRLRTIENATDKRFWFFFDEIQYLKDWERELKVLTDLRPNIRFVASGSAAAALSAKSRESGAGRFTTFLLPPLTFDEYLAFQNEDELDLARLRRFADAGFSDPKTLREVDVLQLNVLFERYCSHGGYPEAVLSTRIQANMDRFVREDIVEKVLLRDLPSLYGISDTRELNSLFTTLAFNTAQEISIEGLSQSSSVAKNTIKRYIEYLEAAFLMKRVRRLDQAGKRFQRETAFKSYLTNPSLRAALFRPLAQDDAQFGHLAETAVFSQWFHFPIEEPFYYARWKQGEVDMVNLDGPAQSPDWFVEVKWSDRHLNQREEWKAITAFVSENDSTLQNGWVTSRTKFGARTIAGLEIKIIPTAVYCWMVGRKMVKSRTEELADEGRHHREPTLFDIDKP
ncbi:MAG: ATP-binding protein [Hoeflea sp.]|uniref:ATP-binding protein n=1 Tax=Hoeflea sp. TaxID=1940281 RepID=UPI0032EDA259